MYLHSVGVGCQPKEPFRLQPFVALDDGREQSEHDRAERTLHEEKLVWFGERRVAVDVLFQHL